MSNLERVEQILIFLGGLYILPLVSYFYSNTVINVEIQTFVAFMFYLVLILVSPIAIWLDGGIK